MVSSILIHQGVEWDHMFVGEGQYPSVALNYSWIREQTGNMDIVGVQGSGFTKPNSYVCESYPCFQQSFSNPQLWATDIKCLWCLVCCLPQGVETSWLLEKPSVHYSWLRKQAGLKSLFWSFLIETMCITDLIESCMGLEYINHISVA